MGDVPVVRALFERAICLDLQPRKMKVLSQITLFTNYSFVAFFLNPFFAVFLDAVPFQEVFGLRKEPRRCRKSRARKTEGNELR